MGVFGFGPTQRTTSRVFHYCTGIFQSLLEVKRSCKDISVLATTVLPDQDLQCGELLFSWLKSDTLRPYSRRQKAVLLFRWSVPPYSLIWSAEMCRTAIFVTLKRHFRLYCMCGKAVLLFRFLLPPYSLIWSTEMCIIVLFFIGQKLVTRDYCINVCIISWSSGTMQINNFSIVLVQYDQQWSLSNGNFNIKYSRFITDLYIIVQELH
jgi:hypothetical protein